MPQVNLGDLEDRVWARLDQNTLLYPKVDVDRLINEGARSLNLFTGFSQGLVPAGLTAANWQWYRIPPPVVFPMRIYLEGKMLNKNSANDASSTNPRWFRGAARSLTRSWVPVGTTMFGIIDPDPTGGKFLECWGVTTPPLLVADDDALTIDDEYAGLIEQYAFMNLVLKEGGQPFTDASRGYKDWLKRATALQRWETHTVNPRYWIEVDSKSGAKT